MCTLGHPKTTHSIENWSLVKQLSNTTRVYFHKSFDAIHSLGSCSTRGQDCFPANKFREIVVVHASRSDCDVDAFRFYSAVASELR